MTIVVGGSSGQLGSAVAEGLLERVRPADVVLVTRRPGLLERLAARGATVRYGDYDRPDTLPEAFRGGDRLLLVSTDALDRRESQHRAAIGAAVAAGIGHVVYTSILSPVPANPVVVARSHQATEEMLAASGLAWTFLRNSLYSEFQVVEAAHCLATGRLAHNRGDGRVAYVSRDDCAAAAVAVLCADGHGGAAYDITGPELFGAAELASLYGALGNRPVDVVGVDDQAIAVAMLGDSTGDDHAVYGAELVASMGRAIREGHLDACTGAVAELTGRPARTLKDVLLAHEADLLAAARRRPGSRA